jgi:hypothetical protein
VLIFNAKMRFHEWLQGVIKEAMPLPGIASFFKDELLSVHQRFNFICFQRNVFH